MSSDWSSGPSDASSSAYVLFETNSKASEPALSESTPILAPQLSDTLRAKVERRIDSAAPATPKPRQTPQFFGAEITFREKQKKTRKYRTTNRSKLSPLIERTPGICHPDYSSRFQRKNRGQLQAVALKEASIFLIDNLLGMGNN